MRNKGKILQNSLSLSKFWKMHCKIGFCCCIWVKSIKWPYLWKKPIQTIIRSIYFVQLQRLWKASVHSFSYLVLLVKIWPIHCFENFTRNPENNDTISKKIKALRGWPFWLSQYFFVILGSFADTKKILGRKISLNCKSLNFFRKLLFFSGNS